MSLNLKPVIGALVVFTVLNGLFVLYTRGIMSLPGQTTKVELPVDRTHKGVSSATLFYQFSGKVTKIEPVGKNTRIALDISDSQLPEFLATPDTSIYGPSGPGSEAKTIRDVKVGWGVVITMTYDLNNKTWKMNYLSSVSK